jgi:hypothetical protein
MFTFMVQGEGSKLGSARKKKDCLDLKIRNRDRVHGKEREERCSKKDGEGNMIPPLCMLSSYWVPKGCHSPSAPFYFITIDGDKAGLAVVMEYRECATL